MRHNFSKRKELGKAPNLVEIQHNSYNWLVEHGINEILTELGSVEDQTGRGWILTLSNPTFDEENLTIDDAVYKGRTYDAPWYIDAELTDPISKETKKQVIYMGDIPLMTPSGTFIINGVERVIINQLKRAEGVLFSSDVHPSSGARLGGAKIVPKNGVWLELDTSKSGVISVKIDRRRKMPITVLLRIFGLETDEEILEAFEDVDTNPEVSYLQNTIAKDVSSSYNEAVLEVYKKIRPGEPLVLENACALVNTYFFNNRRYSLGKVGRFKLNKELELDYPEESKYFILQLEDFKRIISRIIDINNGKAEPSDVDHLSNRRVRSVGELLQDEIRIGFLRMERNIKERMSLQPREELPEPPILIASKTVSAAIHSFLLLVNFRNTTINKIL